MKLPTEKRERIIDLAIEEFSERPYAQASLSRIVARAGIAKGSVYQYFDDKRELYRWLLTEELPRRKLAHLDAHPPPAGSDLFDTLEHMFVAGLGFLLENPRLARLGATVLEPTAEPEIRELHAEVRALRHAYLVRVVREAQDAGSVRQNADAELVAHLVAALMSAGLSDALLGRLGVTLHGLLADPSVASRMTLAEVRALAREATLVLRRGIGAPS
ncbi:TetR/AcrR family transcriptional regulator [Polyangium aurulentum]|uniref:TetR/AcrR family transcriptional regulator n=1 Tax=Polyangium aurulentum TaxID=2567896 RepID=UPI00146C7E28|nr:TetR/AcrR family transcriptional regulator [Polyangium aurulentum]UQA58358.1 TetR/AcrR family transcriptional regulator [Polyangium aurulentum]